ncbi:hypothetical protein B0H11DRAFT_2027845 [Mycena galericulata]|nr:hypothetical protein B0H11DRAFT_2027845 [Mycena galericulata]
MGISDCFSVLIPCRSRRTGRHVRITEEHQGPHEHAGLQIPLHGILRNHTPRPPSNYGATNTQLPPTEPGPPSDRNKRLPDLPRQHRRVPPPVWPSADVSGTPRARPSTPFIPVNILSPSTPPGSPTGAPNPIVPPGSAATATSSSPRFVPQSMPMDYMSPPRPPLVNLPNQTNIRPIRSTHRHTPPASTRPRTHRVRVSPHDGASHSPRRARQSTGTGHRSATRRNSTTNLNPCMFCNVCPQHQHLLNTVLSAPQCTHHSCVPTPPPTPAAWHASCQIPPPSKLTPLPYTPAQLMCMSGFQPWMNSRVYVQRPFY